MNKNLPPNWSWVKLGDVCEFFYGKGLTKSQRNQKGEYPVYGSNGIVGSHDEYFVEGPCIVIGRKGAAGEVHISKNNCWPIDTTYYVKNDESYSLDFLYYAIKNLKLESLDKSTAIPGLNRNDAYQLLIPLPPLTEQRDIVSKLESLFSELDKGVETLRKAKEQIKTYRQSVLASAFEGKLTEGKRKKEKGKMNPFLPDMELSGESLNIAAEAKAVYKTNDLPEGWKWVKLGEIGTIKRGKSKHRPRNAKFLYGGIYPFIQTGDIRNAEGKFINKYTQTYSEEGLKQSKLWERGTLCISIAANIADTAILGFDSCFPDSVVGFVADENYTTVNYVHYFFIKEKNNIENLAPATAQKNINVSILENLLIPLPQLVEQNEIISEIERRFSVADKLEQSIDEGLAKAEQLRQSILKKAFEGKLI
jgi:type I restriction enzyme S subunit